MVFTNLKSRTYFLVPFSLFLLSSLIGAAAEKATTDGPSSVWVAEKDGHKMYLAGTIHLLRAKDYPLPEVYEEAYKDSERLVFELPPGSEGSGEVVIRMRQLGSYPEDQSLDASVTADTLKRVKEWAGKHGFPAAAVSRMRPWFLSLTIAAIEYQSLGAAPDRGLDHVFEQRAAKDGKAGAGLESVEEQLTLFSRLTEKMQEELLLQTLGEIETMQKDYDDMIGAWRSGNTEKLNELLYRDADKFPELMKEFLTKRNEAWVAPLLRHMEGKGNVMVLVGAGHLGGKNGLLELLKSKGCTIRQLRK